MAMRSHIDSSLCNSKNIKYRNNTYSKFLDLIIIHNLPEGDCVLVNSLVEEEFMTVRREIVLSAFLVKRWKQMRNMKRPAPERNTLHERRFTHRRRFTLRRGESAIATQAFMNMRARASPLTLLDQGRLSGCASRKPAMERRASRPVATSICPTCKRSMVT